VGLKTGQGGGDQKRRQEKKQKKGGERRRRRSRQTLFSEFGRQRGGEQAGERQGEEERAQLLCWLTFGTFDTWNIGVFSRDLRSNRL